MECCHCGTTTFGSAKKSFWPKGWFDCHRSARSEVSASKYYQWCIIWGLLDKCHQARHPSFVKHLLPPVTFGFSVSYRDVLAKNEYVKIHTIRLVGILLSLYAKKAHLTSIRNVETSYTRTGLNGLWVFTNHLIRFWLNDQHLLCDCRAIKEQFLSGLTSKGAPYASWIAILLLMTTN